MLLAAGITAAVLTGQRSWSDVGSSIVDTPMPTFLVLVPAAIAVT